MEYLGQRVARLEAESEMAKPLHDRFQTNLDGLNDRTARIETKVDRLLKNGHGRSGGWGDKTKAAIIQTAPSFVGLGGILFLLSVLGVI